jgi:hypothetical protein
MTTDEIIAAIDKGFRSDEDRFKIAEAAVTEPYDLPHVGKGRQVIFHSGNGPLNDCFNVVRSAAVSGFRQVEYHNRFIKENK